jgi:hypothetical protein
VWKTWTRNQPNKTLIEITTTVAGNKANNTLNQTNKPNKAQQQREQTTQNSKQ